MNTKIDNKTRLRAFSTNVVALLVGVVAVLVFGNPSVQAQTTTTDGATAVDSSITVPTTGTVTEGTTTVALSGSVTIKARKVIDNTTTTLAPLVMLDFDFSQLKGTTGNGKNLKTFVTGDNHATELRPFQATDTIVVTVPYFDSTTDGGQANTFMATATLNFDTSTGKLTGGSLTYGNNIFKSSGVGTFTVN
jgi:hypothetical protein